jgi:hypothetical protein
MKKAANDFIKKCNVVGLVHANEGGVIELNSLLIDFATKDESVKEYWFNEFQKNLSANIISRRIAENSTFGATGKNIDVFKPNMNIIIKKVE